MIGILNYSAGNIKSVQNALNKLNIANRPIDKLTQLEAIDGLIIPGVGAFGFAMEAMRDMGFTQKLLRDFSKKKGVLGICLGMQVLFESGTEGGACRGFAFLEGCVTPFSNELPVPHMGWNRVEVLEASPLTKGLEGGFDAYYAHSFKVGGDFRALGKSVYGEAFVAIAGLDNVFGVQFHPEKSGEAGLTLLKNFKERCDEIISSH